jgi:Flp pilus assembly pilin Flp
VVRFLFDEEAQATTEYILILAVMVTIAIVVVRDLIKPVLEAFRSTISKSITDQMFRDSKGMHQSPFKKP